VLDGLPGTAGTSRSDEVPSLFFFFKQEYKVIKHRKDMMRYFMKLLLPIYKYRYCLVKKTQKKSIQLMDAFT
jgi:hypothetical protein